MARSALVVALLATLLSGCLGPGDHGPPDAMQIPNLPSGFRADYARDDGSNSTVSGRTHQSLDQYGRIRDILLVTIEGPAGDGRTLAFSGCGEPIWSGDRTDGRTNVAVRSYDAPVWLSLQGLRIEAGEELESRNGMATIERVAGRSFEVSLAYGDRTRVAYDSRPVPSMWADTAGTWTLTGFTAGADRQCASGEPALTDYGREGPTVMPKFPDWSLHSVLSYLRGPLGPLGFHSWEDRNPDGWLRQLFYSPPILSPIPDQARPAAWTLRFSAPNSSSGLEVTCQADAADREMPLAVRPFRCLAQDEETPLASPPNGRRFPDPEAAARTFDALGLPPSSISGYANASAAGLEMASWEKEYNAQGFTVQIYSIFWNDDGRIRRASLPLDSPIL